MPNLIKPSASERGTLIDMETTRTVIETAPGAAPESPEPGRDCWFCQDAIRTDPPPGGWLLDDGIWRAGAAPVGMAAAGTVVLEAKRHVQDQSGFDTREAITFVPSLGAVLTAMRTGLGCDRVYQWSTMAAYPHFHVWLIPWWQTSAHEGPAHLLDTVESPATEADVTAATARIAQALR